MSESIVNRAILLIEQHRYNDAESILKTLLSSQPDDPDVYLLLAQVSVRKNKINDADNYTNTAISLDPDNAAAYYLKCHIALERNEYDNAESYISQAISADPMDADYYALHASIKLKRKKYDAALELADKALECDAENVMALNTRSSALVKLNRGNEAFQTIEGALKEDPNNAYTHANYGWGLLEKGNHKKALEHFSEALKINPNSEIAISGMGEALKANNILYRGFLKYGFWVNKLTAKYQWAFIIGLYFATRFLLSLSKNNETLKPFLIPVITILVLFAFSTWIITPISNLLLRLNKYGRHLLDREEIMSSNYVGIALLVFIISLTSYFITQNDIFLMPAFYGLAMTVPLGSMFSASKNRKILVGYTIALATIGMIAVVISFTGGEVFNLFSIIFVFGFVAFQWIANYFLIKQDNV